MMGKRAYGASRYAKPYERYCRERFPEEAGAIFRRAEGYYREFCKEMPDLGKNLMAANMLDWFTILAFYEASGHRPDGEALLAIKRREVDRLKFLGRFIVGSKIRLPSSCSMPLCKASKPAQFSVRETFFIRLVSSCAVLLASKVVEKL